MRLGAFELDEPLPQLREPHVLATLQPWVNVGNVGTLTMAWLENHFAARELGRLARPGSFYDFTRYRPTMYMKEGRREMSVPNSYVTYCQGEANDFLFLHLLEPHSQGETYVDSLLELMTRFGAKRYCLMGSMYDLVPHTRPLPITGSIMGRETPELAKLGVHASNYQGPTSIVSLLPQMAMPMGIETMSLIIHLPQYSELGEDFIGTARLMKVLAYLYHVPVDATCGEKAKQQIAQISGALDKNPDLKAVVEQLEGQYDAAAKSNEEQEKSLSPEIEKFLSEMEKRFEDE